MEINAEVFEHAGVYHYVVTEDAGSYEGIDMIQQAEMFIFLYITESDGALYVGNVIQKITVKKVILNLSMIMVQKMIQHMM